MYFQLEVGFHTHIVTLKFLWVVTEASERRLYTNTNTYTQVHILCNNDNTTLNLLKERTENRTSQLALVPGSCTVFGMERV